MPETSTVDFKCKEHFANKIYKQILKVLLIRSLKTLPHNVYEPTLRLILEHRRVNLNNPGENIAFLVPQDAFHENATPWPLFEHRRQPHHLQRPQEQRHHRACRILPQRPYRPRVSAGECVRLSDC